MRPPFDAPVLVLVDPDPSARNAAWRAGLVARDLRVGLRLLLADRAAAASLRALVAAIRGRLRIPVEPQVLEGDPLPATVGAARAASLLVLGPRRGNALREFVLGTQAERLIRLCRIPVLVVRQPATGGYRRVLVPVDLGPEAGRLIAAAGALSRDPRMEVLHALPTREELAMRVADVPEAAVRRQRQRAAQRAHALLEELIAFAGAAGHGVVPSVTFGDPALAVLARARALRAGLVVIGKRQRGLLADFFLGGVTQRVLAEAQADVLVLPVARGPAATAVRPVFGELAG